jgi:hypothetical protein
MAADFEYDIGLSFAGEDRKLVEEVLLELSRRNIRAFYDRAETPKLWGEHGGVILGEIYTKQCRHFMPFISEHYVKKAWPNFEFKKALTKAILTQETFMLPVRIDDAEFELLDEGVFYVDLQKHTPADVARFAAIKLGIPLDEDKGESAVAQGSPPTTVASGNGPPDADSQTHSWPWETDRRVQRHRAFIESTYEFWTHDSVWSIHASLPSERHLSQERLDRTFLNTNVRYSEALNYAVEITAHAKGFTREFPSHRRREGEIPIETYSCYEDGLVTYDVSLNQQASYPGRSGLWLNMNAATYEIQRFLQLANEVFDDDERKMDVLLLLKNLDSVVVPVFNQGNVAGQLEYCGYHEPIVRRVQRAQMSDRANWNKICPPVVDLLRAIARIFGATDIPQTYWDSAGILDYSKIGNRR